VEGFGGEKEFVRLILGELRPSDVLYDIGACVGLVTVHAARKGICTVAFEPDPSYRLRLEKNLRLNKLNDVKILEWAVSDRQGEATLFTDGVEGLSPSLVEIGKRGSVKIRTDTIDNALERGDIRVPDVLKIDIEGAETLALRGMGRLLGSDKAPRTIFIETHPDFLPGFGSSELEVISLLCSFGYRKSFKARISNRLSSVAHYVFVKQIES
jgi:FkbM family methyltransferase